ncbi:hypothetical protein [Streptosporangium sp. KLBMP 9127]|nr:hypothetical protein [Streptosporangium sp. KLBMP 9127]
MTIIAWHKSDIRPDDALLEMVYKQGFLWENRGNEYHERLRYMQDEEAGRYGRLLMSFADSLVDTVSTITAKGHDLADAWGGDAGKEALRELGVLRKAVIDLASAVGTVGEGVRWFGEDVLPVYKGKNEPIFGPNYLFDSSPIWDHQFGGNNCDCSVVYFNPLSWTGVDSATCIRQEHEYYYEYSDIWISHPRDAVPVVSREDFYSSVFGTFINETERQAIEDRRLDPYTAHRLADARRKMDRVNSYIAQLHAFMPAEVTCDFPDDT